MKEDNKDGVNTRQLRQKAEEQILKKFTEITSPSGEADLIKLLHELDVQHIELELKNDELKLAVERTETATALYDFAPSGYFTLGHDGTIFELNHSGANLLSKERSQLIDSNFKLFISQDTLPDFNSFFGQIFETTSKQKCEVCLSVEDQPPVYIYLEGIVSENPRRCLLTMVDITERKQTENALRKSEEENRVIIDVNPDILFRINKQGYILDYRAPANTHFYVPPEVFLGNKIADVMPSDVAQRIMETIGIACQTGEMATMEYELTTDGKREFFENRVVPMSHDELFSFVRDISARKESEAELSNNYSLLRIAGETASFGGWIADLEENKVIWSDEVALIHGKPKGYSPLISEAISYYSPECVDRIKFVFSECVKKGTPYDEELVIINIAGDSVWVRVTGEAVRENNGKIVKIQGSFQDISEKKQAEEALRKSEEKFRVLNEMTSEMLRQPDLESLYNYIATSLKKRYNNTVVIYNSVGDNKNETKVEAISGVDNLLQNKVVKSIGFHPVGKMFEILPEYLDLVKTGKLIECNNGLADFAKGALSETVAQIIQKIVGIHRIYTIAIIHDEKLVAAVHLMTFNKATIDDAGFIEAFVGQAAIIVQKMMAEEALRKSEELLSLFVKNSPIYAFIKEVTPTVSRVLKASENYKDMIGIAGSEMVGKTMYELFPAEFAAKITADDWTIVSEGKILTLEEELNNRSYTTIKFPISLGDDNLLAGYSIDVTDRERAEEALRKSEASLSELNATKDKFFSIIAHDLRSPFHNIVGFSNLLVRDAFAKNYEGIEKFADIIQDSSIRALELLKNLLEWSRSQTGRMKFTPIKLHVNELADVVIRSMIVPAQFKNISICTNIPNNLTVSADKEMLSAILRNLISNAIKFTNPEGTIVVAAGQQKNEIQISVTDNGVGIEEDGIWKLFRIDQNHSTTGTHNEKGTGLGLILCKEFVDKHGGRIWVESEVGKGSMFYFTIPKH